MSEQAEPVQSGQTSLPDSKGLGGRPPKVNKEVKEQLLNAYRQYIQDNIDPNIARFVSSDDLCFEHGISDHDIYNWQEFDKLRKLAVKKQEAYLLEQAGSGKYNPTLAIFRLKQPQHGYRDRYETDVTSNGESIGLTGTQAEQLLALRAERGNEDS